tara:strand:- start:3655 stop:5361 length:1707 start_codon:yes stop_codon:yes gene_type:complete
MAINWSAGLISAGGSFKDYSAVLLKEEYMQEERDIAASSASAARFMDLYKELGLEARNITDALSRAAPMGGISKLDPATKKAFEDQLSEINSLRVTMFSALSGVSPTSSISDDVANKILKKYNEIMSGKQTSEEGSAETEGSDGFNLNDIPWGDHIFKYLPGFAKETIAKAEDWAVKEAADYLKNNETYKELWDDTKNNLERTRVRYSGSGEDRKEIKGPVSDKEVVSVIAGEFAEAQITKPLSRIFSFLKGEEVPEEEFIITDDTVLSEIGASTGELTDVFGPSYKSEADWRRINQAQRGEREFPPAYVPPTQTGGDAGVAEDNYRQGLIEQGARYTEQDTAQETPGGGISEEPLLESETVDGIPQTGIGSEAALRSLYEDVGGPIGEPTGNVVYPTNIPKESEEIETKKTSLNRTLGALVKYAESNVNGYNAVAGSDEGDANLTNMTLREIREKYGNTAVGVGQFKYNEFIKPTADKYMNIDEETLLSTVFSRDFQEQLLTLGLEDAGMTLFLKGRIDEETFMKRLWNIFRGLAPKKESLPGEVTDEYGNKVNVGGGLISQALERY